MDSIPDAGERPGGPPPERALTDQELVDVYFTTAARLERRSHRRHRPVAWEATSDTLITIIERYSVPERFDPSRGQATTLAYPIAERCLHRLLLREKVPEGWTRVAEHNVPDRETDGSAAQLDEAWCKELEEALAEALNTLSERQKLAFTARQEGKPFAAIADEIAVGAGGARILYFRACRALAEHPRLQALVGRHLVA